MNFSLDFKENYSTPPCKGEVAAERTNTSSLSHMFNGTGTDSTGEYTGATGILVFGIYTC